MPTMFTELRYNAFLSRGWFDKVLLSDLGMKVKVFRLTIEIGLNDKVLLVDLGMKVKVFRLTMEIGLNDKVLLVAERGIC
ncbi:hypothetical protein E6H21_05270 [Candidatus Bathyarchaeota archaeon]|nr:MAG: hypothetical protein E6H21_05270 [Candidatus Bathyarchaeota archaeon]